MLRVLKPNIAALSFLFLTVTASQSAVGQESPSLQLTTFEVASVKPMDQTAQHRVGVDVFPGGRTVISGLSLRALIGTAFHLSYWQISGGEAWTSKDVYMIEATPGKDSAITNIRHSLFAIEDEHLRQMLQALLIDRFKLKFHWETRTGDVYFLEQNGKPLKLRRLGSTDEKSSNTPALNSSFSSIGWAGGEWGIFATSMPQLAKFASDFVLHAPVLDHTNLEGVFEYRQSVPDPDSTATDNTDSFLRFIRELGIKLERTKGSFEILVIDSASALSSN